MTKQYVANFLTFIARVLERHPERVQALDSALFSRMETLVGSIDIKLDVRLSAEDE